MWVWEKMMSKHELFENIPLHVQKLNYKYNVYELGDHIKEEALNSNLIPKLGEGKKNFSCKFF
jgi:hypothetical protein